MAKKPKKNARRAQPSKGEGLCSGDRSTGRSSVPQSAVASKTFPHHLVPAKRLRSRPNNGNGHRPSPSDVIVLHPGSVFLVRNFFDTAECGRWIDHAESEIGFETVSHPATTEVAHRRCGRIQREDWNVADGLYDRMRPVVDEVAGRISVARSRAAKYYRPVGCNGNIRLYKYEKGMSFGRHYDGSNPIPRYPGWGNTEITVLVYLSSCEGGATRFYPPQSSAGSGGGGKGKRRRENSAENKGGIAFVPEAGSILLHVHGDQCLAHEADPVERGVKYVLRTDVVYGTGRGMDDN